MFDSEYRLPRENVSQGRTARLIGLGGLLRSGKDTAADHLVAEHGYVKFGMSDALADALYRLNPWIPFENATVNDEGEIIAALRYQALVDEAGYVEAKTYPEVRRLLQALGTEVGRDLIGPETWTDIIKRRIQESDRPVVVTGIRFPNELKMIQDLGGTTVWILRDAKSLSKPLTPLDEAITRHPAGKARTGAHSASQHASETSVSPSDFQHLINNTGSLAELFEAIETVALGREIG